MGDVAQPERDNRLDYLKGIACIMMIFAHAPGITDHFILKLMRFTGDFAPVLFFAVAGISSAHQAKKYSMTSIFILYACFAILGISNGYEQVYKFEMGLLQMIATGCVLTALLEKINPQKVYSYFYGSLLILGISILYKTFHPDSFGFASLLFPSGNAGPFPIFPWLSFFFLGVFAYRISNSLNLILAIAALICIGVLYGLEIPLGLTQKWHMNVGYFLLCCHVLFLFFFVVKSLPFFAKKSSNLVLYFGRHSLPFFYIHFVFVKIFGFIFIDHMPLIWISVTLFTILALRLCILISKSLILDKFFQSFWVWLIMMILITLIPLLIKNPLQVYTLETGLGLLFAFYYPSLSRSIKKAQTQS